MINENHAGAVVSVWDVDDLPQAWVDFFIGVNEDLPQAIARQKKVDQQFAQFEAAHPQYGKRQ